MKRLILAGCALTVFVVQAESTIVNLALHALETYFHVAVATLQSIVDAYNLAYALLILPGGLLADAWGKKRVFMLGALAFAAGCTLSSAAPDVTLLIVGRALSGIGAALALPASLALVVQTFTEEREREHAVAIWAGFNGVAISVGPPLGGFLLHWFGWRSIFSAVIVVAVACVALIAVAAESRAERDASRIDLRRAVALFRNASFASSVVTATCMTFGMYAFLFELPRFVQGTKHADPAATGLALMCSGVVFAALTPFASTIAQRVGRPNAIALGMLTIGSGHLLSLLTLHTAPIATFALAAAFTGAGMGLATGALMAMAVGSAQSDARGTASAFVNTGRMAGATLGVALLGALPVGHAMPVAATVECIGAAVTYFFATKRNQFGASTGLARVWLPKP
jgi:MFS transporter, DHA2 family, methylenomycin A resistance protein